MSNTRKIVIQAGYKLLLDTNSKRFAISKIPIGSPGTVSPILDQGDIIAAGECQYLEISKFAIRVVDDAGGDVNFQCGPAGWNLMPTKDPSLGQIIYTAQ